MDPGIIDIGSDHELADNEYDSDFDYEAYNDRYDFADGGAFGGGVTLDDANDGGMIDLTGCSDVPDVDDPPAPVPNNNAAADAAIDDEHLSAAACLQMVLNILPDISVVHVLTLLDETAHTPAACERIIEQLLDGGAYPKENDEVANRKRKREREDTSDSDQGGVEVDMPTYNKDALALLKDEFLSISVRHIESVFGEQKSLFKAYGILKEQFREAHSIHHKDAKLKAPRAKRDVGLSMSHRGRPILKELRKAQRKEEGEASKYQKVQDSELLEQENLRQAKRMDEMGECLCCFDDFPINRMTSCSGDTVHFFCLSCAKKYAEGEMGMGRIKLVCFADSNCGGTFARGQLQRFLGETSFERFEHMQQQHELAAAGLDFLSECPFCDFKAECLPVKVDKEFRCENPKCRKVSCRLCQAETHIPLSCEEFRKDSKLSLRHKVEEAMSAALIRNCNKCKHPFVKDHGCNKMTCTRCGNVQCYVCSKDVKDYQHFRDSHIGGGTNGTCPLHDNVEERHEQEVKKAADEAKAKVLAEDPNVSDADLMIRVSDRVERAEQSRRGRAQVEAAHIGGVLANGPPMLHRPREPQPVLGHLPRYRPGFPPPQNAIMQQIPDQFHRLMDPFYGFNAYMGIPAVQRQPAPGMPVAPVQVAPAVPAAQALQLPLEPHIRDLFIRGRREEMQYLNGIAPAPQAVHHHRHFNLRANPQPAVQPPRQPPRQPGPRPAFPQPNLPRQPAGPDARPGLFFRDIPRHG